jgi:hypothetical protein
MVRALVAEMVLAANGTNLSIGENCFSTVTEIRLVLFVLGLKEASVWSEVPVQNSVCAVLGPVSYRSVIVLNAPT